jgi:hypothetical protein
VAARVKDGPGPAEVGVVTSEQRCPQCSALVHPGVQWCSLCHADLRPLDEREPEPVPLAEPVEAAAGGARGRHARSTVAAERAPLLEEPGPADPATAPVAGTVTTAEDRLAAAGIDVDAMLQQLAAQHAAQPLGGLSSRLSDKSSRTYLVIGGVLGLTLLSFLGMFLLGSVFG